MVEHLSSHRSGVSHSRVRPVRSRIRLRTPIIACAGSCYLTVMVIFFDTTGGLKG